MASAEEDHVAQLATATSVTSPNSPAPVTLPLKAPEESRLDSDSVDRKQKRPQAAERQLEVALADYRKKRRGLNRNVKAALLPGEVLRNIFLRLDAEAFASASLVCLSWRNVSDDAKLYEHHLPKIQISPHDEDATSPSGPDDGILPELKQKFAQEAKRSLFFPFLRPKITTVSLMAEAPLSSFAAGPGGEKFEFVFSQFARWCLGISSSRIYVISLEEPKMLSVVKELKVLRRPLAADILPDGSIMAVLSSDHSVSLYGIEEDKVQLKRSVDLDNIPYTIAMSPGGEILAAAFDGGLELCSLRETASPSEKRSVKTHRVDRLMFSSDGSMLLGTTQSRDPATVILTAPYFSAAEFDLTPSELVNSMWTQQILFPSSSRDCSHSTLLPRTADQDSNWTLTYDRTYESFRAVRTDDLRNGTTYFTGPENGSDRRVVWPKDALIPSTLPSATAKGDLVAAGFNSSEIWLYGVPEILDAGLALPDLPDRLASLTDATQEGINSNHDKVIESEGPPKWQMLVDKYRNVFSKGKKVAEISGVSSMCWYKPTGSTGSSPLIAERLVLAAPGGVGSDYSLDEETPIDGGRIVILDFGLFPSVGESEEITIELGTKEAQLLEEQKPDMETEIARVRRRTLAQRDAARVRSVLDALRPDNSLEDVPEVPPLPGSSTVANEVPVEQRDVSDDEEPGVSLEEAAAFAEGPYSHANPRSRTALYRSATVNQASRRRAQQTRAPEEPAPLPLRRQDGTEVPDESDADNWIPPPPPYQRHAEELLPDDLVQRALLYNGIAPLPSTAESMVRPRRSSSLNDGTSSRRRSSVDVDLLAHHLRPSMPLAEQSVTPGDASAVSSVTVTPRSSVRRRPLTVYQSSSHALRESAINRSTSQLTRTSSLSSSRLSRSESLRQNSQTGSETVLTAAAAATATAAAAGVSSPLASAAGPAAGPGSVASMTHMQGHTPSRDYPEWPLPAPREEAENVSPTEEPSPPSGPEPDHETDARLSPESDFLERHQREPAPEMEALPEPVSFLENATEQQALPHDEPEGPHAVEPEPREQQSLQDAMSMAVLQPRTVDPPDPSNYDMPSDSVMAQQSPIISPSTQNHAMAHPIPEPSALQISALHNRPRPQIRPLSGAAGLRRGTPSPVRQPSQPTTAELPDTNIQSKQERPKASRSLSRRLRGALRREDDEPMPELPQVPLLVESTQPSHAGPARHSRLYANQRNNASEPALRVRPQAQRLDTIQSVNSQMLRADQGLTAQSVSTADPVRPQPKRNRSIFGRRKSRSGGTGPLIPLNQDMPPVPPVPSMSNAGPMAPNRPPALGSMRRAATEYPYTGFREETAYLEMAGAGTKRRKNKDKDGKCNVM